MALATQSFAITIRVALSALCLLFAACKPAPDVENIRDDAASGNGLAQLKLGLRYEVGDGVKKDLFQAFSWYRKAAEQGLPVAQLRVGMAYYYGEGVAIDYGQAAKWYRKSADQGLDMAQFYLGGCYATGNGTEEDKIEAYAYYLLSKLPDDFARHAMAKLENTLTQEQIKAGQLRAEALLKETEVKKAGK
jgi:TPR repeat protein